MIVGLQVVKWSCCFGDLVLMVMIVWLGELVIGDCELVIGELICRLFGDDGGERSSRV